MPRFPKTKTNVDREEVGDVVSVMLMNEDVGDIECTEQDNGRYTVRPYRRDAESEDAVVGSAADDEEEEEEED
jgi:hypothetical protein